VGSHRGKFRLNRCEGKVMGVCAGIADHFDVDVTLVRVGTALAIVMTMPVVLFAYFILAMIAGNGAGSRRECRAPVASPPLGTVPADAARERMRDLDARMAAIETYVTSSNTQLAREIDELR
jgi:phage shock protein C